MALDAKTLFERHGPSVYRRARRLLGSHALAEEATQEIFLRVLTSGERFEGRSSVTTWLYQITTNYCLNQIRDRRRQHELWEAHGDDEELHGRPPSPPDVFATVRRLLADADEQQSLAAIYVHVDGMSHEEAADVMGVSRRTVGNLIERFHAWARERLEQERSASLPEVGPHVSKGERPA